MTQYSATEWETLNKENLNYIWLCSIPQYNGGHREKNYEKAIFHACSWRKQSDIDRWPEKTSEKLRD